MLARGAILFQPQLFACPMASSTPTQTPQTAATPPNLNRCTAVTPPRTQSPEASHTAFMHREASHESIDSFRNIYMKLQTAHTAITDFISQDQEPHS
ncbi:hypothetical protein AOQ84DRAFT_383952 [Glonium stellatum]|uniref:Uncharacterized protein n=1 Tax=Glonium stellatum TaxID=574774 RepID=A0A8E2EMI3_9PEZI|nr:hypothetical protein AOQ84DRAFT_383952 [Glonium stellatum]